MCAESLSVSCLVAGPYRIRIARRQHNHNYFNFQWLIVLHSPCEIKQKKRKACSRQSKSFHMLLKGPGVSDKCESSHLNYKRSTVLKTTISLIIFAIVHPIIIFVFMGQQSNVIWILFICFPSLLLPMQSTIVCDQESELADKTEEKKKKKTDFLFHTSNIRSFSLLAQRNHIMIYFFSYLRNEQ